MKCIFFALLLSCASVFGQIRNVGVNTNGVLVAPTNFFYTNFIAGANITLTPTFSNITITGTGGGSAADRQYGTAALTNLSANPYVGYTNIAAFQATNSNLTLWALYSTNVWNDRQGGSLALTNLGGNPYVAYTNIAAFQATNSNLTLWALYSTNTWNSRQGGTAALTNLSSNPYVAYTNIAAFQATNANLTDWSLYSTNVWNPRQGGSLALTNLAANPIPFTNILVAGSNMVFFTNSGIVTVSNSIRTITNIQDVARGFGGLADGQVLKYHSASATWTNLADNTSAGGSGATTNDTQFGVSSVLTLKSDALQTNGVFYETLLLETANHATNVYVGGTFFVDTTQYTNCCNTTLLTNMSAAAVIPGNMLTNNGDVVRWSIAGQMAGALATTNNIAVVWGSATLLDTGLQIASNRMWTATGTITRTGNTSQRIESSLWWPGAGSGAIMTNFVGTIAQTNGIDTTFRVQGTGRRVSVLTNMFLKLIYEPAPR